MDVFINKSADHHLWPPNPGVIKWLERRMIHTNTSYAQRVPLLYVWVCLSEGICFVIFCKKIIMLLLKSCFPGRKKKKRLYLVIMVYHTNLRLTSEHPKGVVWDVAEEHFWKKWSKARGLCPHQRRRDFVAVLVLWAAAVCLMVLGGYTTPSVGNSSVCKYKLSSKKHFIFFL